MKFLETTTTKPNYQSEFGQNQSTTNCPVQFEIDIEAAMSRKEHTKAVFFYLTKAYDKTWKHGILEKFHVSQLKCHLPA